MNQKIQLIRPADKKAVCIDKSKYTILKKSILKYLRTKGESTHAEIIHAITEDFKKRDIKFKGSIAWYVEWVKLDLEARKEIKRKIEKPYVRFMLND